MWWHQTPDIEFFMVTDSEIALPSDLCRVRRIQVRQGELGLGFSAKLKLDSLAPARQTLFIDADSLCFGNLNSVFARLDGRPVSVIGSSIANGDWFGDIARLCAHFRVASLPKFNGGVYYLEPGPTAKAVYGRARQLENQYDVLGLKRLRGRPNDELLVAIAMALESCAAFPDDGSILGDPFACPKLLQIDVLRGISRLSNPPPPNPAYRSWYPTGEINPLIVHFLGHFNASWQYKAEAKRLQWIYEKGLSPRLATTAIYLTYSAPANMAEKLKTILRPAYHRLFGPRRLRPAHR